MIAPTDLASLTPAKRADLIYRTATTSAQQRLWEAALGSQDQAGGVNEQSCTLPEGIGIDALMAMISPRAARAAAIARPVVVPEAATSVGDCSGAARLGVNSGYSGAFASAAQRTGLPETALAAIVNAEAAKDRSGRWNAFSRNPRSSAAGLGQFLSGTWQGMAETSGTWLNGVARTQGWLDGKGRVRPAARADLLKLRYDANASIQTTADYAEGNLRRLKKVGIATGADSDAVARVAYLAHHLGPGDAARYLKTGLGDGRAATLLNAQIGSGRAQRAIAAQGDASIAHRAWLEGFVARKVKPSQFA